MKMVYIGVIYSTQAQTDTLWLMDESNFKAYYRARNNINSTHILYRGTKFFPIHYDPTGKNF